MYVISKIHLDTATYRRVLLATTSHTAADYRIAGFCCEDFNLTNRHLRNIWVKPGGEREREICG